MTATALEISYLDPVIPDQEMYFFRPGHIPMEIREKRLGAWPPLFHLMSIHENLLFSNHSLRRFMQVYHYNLLNSGLPWNHPKTEIVRSGMLMIIFQLLCFTYYALRIF